MVKAQVIYCYSDLWWCVVHLFCVKNGENGKNFTHKSTWMPFSSLLFFALSLSSSPLVNRDSKTISNIKMFVNKMSIDSFWWCCLWSSHATQTQWDGNKMWCFICKFHIGCMGCDVPSSLSSSLSSSYRRHKCRIRMKTCDAKSIEIVETGTQAHIPNSVYHRFS